MRLRDNREARRIEQANRLATERFNAEQVAKQAAAARAAKPVESAEERVIREETMRLTPLLDLLNAKTQLSELVQIWKMGTVGEPRYFREKVFQPYAEEVRNGPVYHHYASLSWSKRFRDRQTVNRTQTEYGWDEEKKDAVGTLYFAIQVRNDFRFRTHSYIEHVSESDVAWFMDDRGRPWEYFTDLKSFSRDEPNQARELLVKTMSAHIDRIPDPYKYVNRWRTPVRHPFLLSLGFPDHQI